MDVDTTGGGAGAKPALPRAEERAPKAVPEVAEHAPEAAAPDGEAGGQPSAAAALPGDLPVEDGAPPELGPSAWSLSCADGGLKPVCGTEPSPCVHRRPAVKCAAREMRGAAPAVACNQGSTRASLRAEGGTMIVPQPVYPEQPYPEGGAMYEVLCGGWELVASFAEEAEAIAEPLRLSDHRRDQRIATQVCPAHPSSLPLCPPPVYAAVNP